MEGSKYIEFGYSTLKQVANHSSPTTVSIEVFSIKNVSLNIIESFLEKLFC